MRRRGPSGELSAQQLGAWMLERARERGLELITEEVTGIEIVGGDVGGVVLAGGDTLATETVIVAAGPGLDVRLPAA